jgi:hypothetical protein
LHQLISPCGLFSSIAYATNYEKRRGFPARLPSGQAMPGKSFSIHSLPREWLALPP